MFNINKFLLVSGFELWTSGIVSNRFINCATQPLLHICLFVRFDVRGTGKGNFALPNGISGSEDKNRLNNMCRSRRLFQTTVQFYSTLSLRHTPTD